MKINKLVACACVAVAYGMPFSAFAAERPERSVVTLTITGGQFKLQTPFAPGEKDACNDSEGSNFGGCISAAVGFQNVYQAGETGGHRLDSRSQQPDNALNFNFFGTMDSRRLNAEFFATATGAPDANDWDDGFQGQVDFGDAQIIVVGQVVSLNLGGWYGTWNGTNFFQGTDSTTNGGLTSAAATGSITKFIQPDTGEFEVSWESLIVGGPFDGLTGYWIMQGIVEVPIPEPDTYGMMLAGLGLVGYMAARRRKNFADPSKPS